ncbi:MAG: SRPBCC family protein [Candidatus Acidiferrales bacterium]
MQRVVDRRFVVRAPLQVAWNHLAAIERWPSWAKHIRSVAMFPPGGLSARTRGTFKLSNGIKTSFHMVEFDPPRHWKWTGSFLGSQVLYDHAFSQIDSGRTEIRFTVDVSGGLSRIIGWLFGGIYQKNLDRAVPLLVRKIESESQLRT